MLIGYARVSTYDQRLDAQQDPLQAAGCEKILTDKISGTVAERSGLNEVRKLLRAGDTLVVWRLDRLGRSLRDLLDWVTYLDSQGVALKSLHESIDTSTSTGKLVFHVWTRWLSYSTFRKYSPIWVKPHRLVKQGCNETIHPWEEHLSEGSTSCRG